MLYTNSKMTNKKIDSAVYIQRRKIINIIHEAKQLAALPRINVRITENIDPRSRTLGMAQMGDCIVWIPQKTIDKCTPLQLRHVVFHELLHAAFNVDHVNDCPLMDTVIKKTTKKQQNTLFGQYAKKKQNAVVKQQLDIDEKGELFDAEKYWSQREYKVYLVPVSGRGIPETKIVRARTPDGAERTALYYTAIKNPRAGTPKLATPHDLGAK